MGKIRLDRWEESKKKWEAIIRRLKNKVLFDVSVGWDCLSIVKKCGYCWENPYCILCNLYPQICKDIHEGSRSSFWRLMRCMVRYDRTGIGRVKKNPDFKKALEYAQQIYNAILEDKKNTYQEIK
jgi:hypothetical protein